MLTANDLLKNIPFMNGEKASSPKSIGQTFKFGVKEGGPALYVRTLNGPMRDRADYDDLLQTLLIMKEVDVLRLTFNTPGGNVWTMSQIAEAIKQCRGTVTGIAVGQVMSAGFTLFAHCDNTVILDGAMFMAHGSSNCDCGKTANIFDTAGMMLQQINNMLQTCVDNNMLTPEEYDHIVNRKGTIFIPGSEMKIRLQPEGEPVE